MRSLLDRLNNPLHLLIALACVWLVASSPWIGMYQALPDEPGAIDLSHVVLGLAMLPLGIVYFAACTVGGRWRLYFPWVAGQFGDIVRDLGGIFTGSAAGQRGRRSLCRVEGLLLLALLATALTGALWFLGRGTEARDRMARAPHHRGARTDGAAWFCTSSRCRCTSSISCGTEPGFDVGRRPTQESGAAPAASLKGPEAPSDQPSPRILHGTMTRKGAEGSVGRSNDAGK